jgi:hypothetical protein
MKLCIVMVFVELLMFGDCETVQWHHEYLLYIVVGGNN